MSKTRNQESEMGNSDYEKDMKLLLEIYNDRERKMNAVIPKEHMKTHCNWEKAKGKKDPFTPGGKIEKFLALGCYTSSITHGQRSPVGYSLWGCRQLDMTESIGMHPQYLGNGLEALLQTRLTKDSSQSMVAM